MSFLWWLLPIAAYALGSVSFAYWAGRIAGKDLREHGSKNLGATNAGRVLGGRWFALVFACDVLKGLLPVLLARWAELGWQCHGLGVATGACAILGHIFPCWHGWWGGKAVATSLGVLIGLVWKAAACAGIGWLIAWCIARVCGFKSAEAVGPASMFAALIAPIAHVLTFDNPFSGYLNLLLSLLVFAASAVVLIRHRSNARALLARLSGKSVATPPSSTPSSPNPP